MKTKLLYLFAEYLTKNYITTEEFYTHKITNKYYTSSEVVQMFIEESKNQLFNLLWK